MTRADARFYGMDDLGGGQEKCLAHTLPASWENSTTPIPFFHFILTVIPHKTLSIYFLRIRSLIWDDI